MTGQSAIRVRSLGKRYDLGAAPGAYDTLRDSIADFARSRLGGRANRARQGRPTVWALRDVTFDVDHGQVLGIIGSNGAGKSTLLKVLTRITRPTEGYAEVEGAVGSLLEVGTGFHPELTGRENISLNGALLGMSRQYVKRRFDEIVEFAGIEQFIDTPVKRYSSGMYVRLAFSVAAHLEPDVLIVDEVLAVGDAAFQNRCLSKMESASEEGRTILFVSHNMPVIQRLCSRVLWLDEGQAVADGAAVEIVNRYLTKTTTDTEESAALFGEDTVRHGSGRARFTSAEILTADRDPSAAIGTGESFVIRLHFRCVHQLSTVGFGIGIDNSLDQRVFSMSSSDYVGELKPARVGGTVEIEVVDPNLLPGRYRVTLGLHHSREDADLIRHALAFQVLPRPVLPTGAVPDPRSGAVFVGGRWRFDYS